MILITDGCELAHHNCGGWAYILYDNYGDYPCNGHRWRQGTNQMELLAVINGLKAIQDPSDVTIYTDSNYVIVNAYRQRRSTDLMIAELRELMKLHRVTFIKVKSGTNAEHNRVHNLAREAMFDAIRVRAYRGDFAEVEARR